MQVTLVALYGRKSAVLERYLRAFQDLVADRLGSRFRRYDIEQIHATIVGLERIETTNSSCANRNLNRYSGQASEMDFDGLLGFLRTGIRPMRVQLGGFANADYSFTSRDQRPYTRSFSIQGSNVVAMGWPIESADSVTLTSSRDIYPMVLDGLRRDVNEFNVLHSYHRDSGDIDNDFYLRIGLIDEPEALGHEVKRDLSHRLREWLSRREPVVIDVGPADMAIACYESEELPVSTTRAYSLEDKSLTGTRLRDMYAS